MEEQEKESKVKSGIPWLKWILRLLFLVIAIPFLIFLLLQIPAVQNWSVDQLTSYFSNKMNTKVEIDKVDLSIWRGLELDGFYVEDTAGDTLIYSEYLEVGFKKSLFSVFKRELSLNDVRLINGSVNITKRRNESRSNIEVLLANFGSSDNKDKKSDGSPFNLDLKIVPEQVEIIVNEKTGELDTIVIESIPDTTSFFLTLDELEILEGTFKRYDETSARGNLYPNSIDLSDMELTDLNLKFTGLKYSSELDVSLAVEYLTMEDQRGFTINEMSADSLTIDGKGIDFKNFKLQTNNTDFQNDLKITYSKLADFADLQNRVFFKATFDNAKIGLGDLTYFIKDLNRNDFFIKNKKRKIILDGNYYGRVNRLSGRDVKLYLDNGLQLEGSFDSRNISDANEALINVKVKRLTTNVNFLEQLIPGFKTPNNFEKIGDFNFAGRFDGYFKDFVAFGSLDTELGRADLDMRLDIKEGTRNANYSGEINLVDFDLRSWTDDDNFGVVSFSSQVSNGKGLSLETAFAELYAKVTSFDFKGYTYADFILDGQLKKNKFEGNFSIQDENADFEFDGNIELREGRPYLDFEADIHNLDFTQLRLTNDQLSVSGKLDINMKMRDCWKSILI